MNKRLIIFLLILILVINVCTVSFANSDEIISEDEIITKIEDEAIVGETGDSNTETDEDKTKENDEEKVEWTDFSNAKVTIERDAASGGTCVDMKITGVKCKKGHSYELYIGENKENLFQQENDILSNFAEYNNGEYIKTLVAGDYFLFNKKYYYGISEYYAGERKRQIEATELKLPELPELGARMDIYMHIPKSSTTFFNVYSTKQSLKINYKIGIVDNIDILKKFKTDKKQAFKELLDYSKKAKYLTTGSVEANKNNNFNPIDSVKIQDGKYYFAYFSLDTENGKYREVEDVAIYQGDSENSMEHFAFADMKFDDSDKPTLNNGGVHTTTPTTDEKDPTKAPDKIPYTGKMTLGAIIAILIISTYVFYRKNKNLKGI